MTFEQLANHIESELQVDLVEADGEYPAVLLVVNENRNIEIVQCNESVILLQENGAGPHGNRRWFAWNTGTLELRELLSVIRSWIVKDGR